MKSALPDSPHGPPPFFSRPQLIALAVICGLAMADSGYLLFLKWTGQISHLLGCGGEDGCDEILGGRWSTWLFIPISLWCFLIYLVLLIGAVTATSKRWLRSLALFCAVLFTSAAIWFLALQALVEKQFCLHCCMLHALGLMASVIIVQSHLRLDRGARREALRPAALAGLIAVAALIFGQIWGPQPTTYEITDASAIEVLPTTDSAVAPGERPRRDPSASFPPPREAMGQGDDQKEEPVTPAPEPSRTVTFAQGRLRFTIGEVPLIGDANAAHVLVKYFDYTCDSCKTMHEYLSTVQEEYPGQVAVIVLPCPLNRRCNPFMHPGARNHEHACELARLGLAVWLADAGSFREFHEAMFAQQDQMTPERARILAESLVDPSKLEDAEFDLWIPETLDQNMLVYRGLSQTNPRMPKLLVGDQAIHGIPRSTGNFAQALAERLELKHE